MSAPTHDGDIGAIFAGAGLTAAVETAEDSGRRNNLYALIAALNRHDGTDEWGILVKTDQGGKVPADIAVWRSTREHYDVLLGESGGPCWRSSGIVPSDRWLWQAGPGAVDPPVPVPGNPPADGDVDTMVRTFIPAAAGSLDAIHTSLRAMHTKLDALLEALKGDAAAPVAHTGGTLTTVAGVPIAKFKLTP